MVRSSSFPSHGFVRETQTRGGYLYYIGLPWGLRWWRVYLQCKRLGFDPWVGKIPWRRECQPTPVFLHIYVCVCVCVCIYTVSSFIYMYTHI